MKTKTLLPLLLFCGLAALAGGAVPDAGDAVSIASLLREMTDRDERARFPAPAFTCAQASSYDRATVAPGQPGWFANSDRSMFLRVEHERGRREFVMFDAAGPGAIVRFWMTFSGPNCGRGTLRIYIDGAAEPAVSGSAFDVLSGPAITSAPLADSVSKLTDYARRGHNLYFPIPYAKSCKITYESEHLREDDFGARKKGTEAVYYNINHRAYAPGVRVVSYSAAGLERAAAAITAALQRLSGGNKTLPAPRAVLRLDADLAPGASRSFAVEPSGAPGAIQRLALRLRAGDQEQALRSTLLEIAFDGAVTVRAPVGDFFGVGHRQIPSSTYYTTAGHDGLLQSYWVMPFEKSCVITLRNLGAQPVAITNAAADLKDWRWDARSMHFGAGWRQYTRVPAGPHEKAVDLNLADLRGQGVYVGDGIAIFNTTHRWWGEGDEKVYVDGEKFPSHIGTGTEDYYGYAWCRPEPFTGHPFIAQPVGDGSFAPALSVNTRYRALDGIPFQKSLRFDLELWHWSVTRVNFAPVALWYMLPGGKNLAPADAADAAREPVARDRADIIPSDLRRDAAGALAVEGEDLLIMRTTSGRAVTQPLRQPPRSGGAHLWWRDLAPGARATLAFNSDTAGPFNLTAFLTTARDYGTFAIRLNGKPVFPSLNLNTPKLAATTAAAPVTLNKGANTLEIELLAPAAASGTPAATKTHFGLDKLVFEPAPAP
ncbi:MAG: DUF2961 domain-containing protein [Opitutaceae bacterium]|jgi:hypothetical protein|nr:DUF2961 domain-containing protein [Opitutaceae bacterium]